MFKEPGCYLAGRAFSCASRNNTGSCKTDKGYPHQGRTGYRLPLSGAIIQNLP